MAWREQAPALEVDLGLALRRLTWRRCHALSAVAHAGSLRRQERNAARGRRARQTSVGRGKRPESPRTRRLDRAREERARTLRSRAARRGERPDHAYGDRDRLGQRNADKPRAKAAMSPADQLDLDGRTSDEQGNRRDALGTGYFSPCTGHDYALTPPIARARPSALPSPRPPRSPRRRSTTA